MAMNWNWTCNRPRPRTLGTLSTIPQLKGSLRQNQNALGVLLGRPPGPLPELAEGKDTIPQAALGVIVDLPADLLRRRPDVRAVEMQLAAQSAQIGVKEADFYPSISLLGRSACRPPRSRDRLRPLAGASVPISSGMSSIMVG